MVKTAGVLATEVRGIDDHLAGDQACLPCSHHAFGNDELAHQVVRAHTSVATPDRGFSIREALL